MLKHRDEWFVKGVACPNHGDTHKSNLTAFKLNLATMEGWYMCLDPECGACTWGAQRLEHLHDNGPTAHDFDFKVPFDSGGQPLQMDRKKIQDRRRSRGRICGTDRMSKESGFRR